MRVTVQVSFFPEERSLLREALFDFRELPPERHWDGAMALMALDSPVVTEENLRLMISVVSALSEDQGISEVRRDAVEFLTKVLSLLDRCDTYTRTETHALIADLQPLELDPIPSSRVAP